MKKTLVALFISLVSIITSKATAQIVHPEWARNAVVYEINVRQYSDSSKLIEVVPNLERLKDLGVDILWLMPMQPIGEVNRKGKLGSYYSVKDYKKINPEFGTDQDLVLFVSQAHELGFKVIVDWVANHTAWDHEWVKKYPEWYERDAAGKIKSPFDWTDVAKLNYTSKPMRAAMTEAMKYWVTKYDIDGFRCDVAFMVPVDFWNENRKELEIIKPMYMLAEMEANNDINKTPAEYYKTAFNASYAWTFMGASADLSAGKKSVNEFKSIMQKNYAELPSSMHKMFFLTNHDENSWNATIQERYGENWKAIAAMVYTLPQSLPLIYTGEEVGLSRRLKFFERDPIKHAEWMDTTRFSLYRDLIRLYHTNPALKNFQQGSSFQELDVDIVNESNSVYAYKRSYKDSEVYVLLNFSNEKLEFNFKSGRKNFESYNIYSNMIFDNFKGEENYMIAPNSFVIFYK